MGWAWLSWFNKLSGQAGQSSSSPIGQNSWVQAGQNVNRQTGQSTFQLNNLNMRAPKQSPRALDNLTGNQQHYPFPGVSVDGAPWNIYGYPAFATWLAASEDNMILRRFDILHGRVLLYMQDHIVEKEIQLRELDRSCTAGNSPLVHNGSFRSDLSPAAVENARKRIGILEELKVLLKEYDEFILRYRQLRKDPEPSETSVTNVKEWFKAHDDEENLAANTGAITDVESDFINHDGDLVSLVPKVQVPLRALLEKYDWFMLFRLFRDKPRGNHYSDPHTQITYQSEDRIRAIITVMTLAAGLAFLLVPPWGLWLLDTVTAERSAMIIITCVVSGFVILLGSITVSRPFETLGAGAAYAAVLMVFLQIGNGVSGGSSIPVNTIVNSSVINSIVGNSSIASSALANVTRLVA